MKTDLLHGVVACSNARARCILCGVLIPKASKCIKQHVCGAKHKENIELMKKNGIRYSDDTLHCKPCNENLPEDVSVMEHSRSYDHANWMASAAQLLCGEFIQLDTFLSCEQDDIFCEVCISSVNCSLTILEEHVKNVNHRQNITKRIFAMNGILSFNNGNEAWCKVCDKYIDNTILGMLKHIDEEQHTGWFSEIENLIEDQEVSIEFYLTNLDVNFAFCIKCQVEVICNAASIESHVHSLAHLN